MPPMPDPLELGEVGAYIDPTRRWRRWVATYTPPLREWSMAWVHEWETFPTHRRYVAVAFTRAGALRLARRVARAAGHPNAVERPPAPPTPSPAAPTLTEGDETRA